MFRRAPNTDDPSKLLPSSGRRAPCHTCGTPCRSSGASSPDAHCTHLGCSKLVRQYRYPVDGAAPRKQLLQLLRRRAKVNVVDKNRPRIRLLFTACVCSCVVLHALRCCAATALQYTTKSTESPGVDVLPAWMMAGVTAEHRVCLQNAGCGCRAGASSNSRSAGRHPTAQLHAQSTGSAGVCPGCCVVSCSPTCVFRSLAASSSSSLSFCFMASNSCMHTAGSQSRASEQLQVATGTAPTKRL